MTTNPYFNDNYFGAEAQDLLESLIIEGIQAYGLDLYYIPRELVNYDQLFGEDPISKFEQPFKVEFYFNSINQFGGEGEMLAKFGLEIQDELSLIVSIRRFNEAVVAKYNNSELLRPRIGDLIFLMLSGRPAVFEIKFVENKPFFFQLGKVHTYELKMQRIESAGEKIETGIPEIDEINKWTATLGLVLDTGTINFQEGEFVFQGADLASSTASGEVVTWNATTKKLILTRVKGEFVAASNIKGDTTGADWTFPVADTTTYKPNDNEHNHGVVDNELIKDQTTDLLDETESNPLLS